MSISNQSCRTLIRAALTAVFMFMGTHAVAEDPDTILVNGKILTVDSDFSIAEAIAITDGEFSFVGSTSDVLELAGPETLLIELDGKTVVPGFIDGHAHMDREGLKFSLPSLHGARSIDDILAVIETEVANSLPGEWIVTMPVGDYPYYADGPDLLAERRYPTRRDLDKVAPNNPVYIKGPWYYWSGKSPLVSIANSMALRIAGVDADTVAPHEGVDIDRDDSGLPSGIFRESGSIGTVEYTLMEAAPRFHREQRVKALKDSIRRYNAAGTTSIYEGHGIAPVIIDAYRELHENGELTVRSHLVMSPTWDDASDSRIDRMLQSWAVDVGGRGSGDEVLRVSGVHVTAGDSVQDDLRKAASSNPGWAGYSVDYMLPSRRGTFDDLVREASFAGLRINSITYNAATLNQSLEALETVNEQISIADRRTNFQHLSFVTDEQIARMKRLGVVPVVVPGTTIWKNGLGRTIDLTASDANTYVPLRALGENGIRYVFATDNVPIEPLKTIWGAVSRKDMATGRVISPDQRISREDALRAFTINGAYLTFEEDRKGSIEVGKYADLAVLSDDYLEVPEVDIGEIDILLTMMGGDIVFRHQDLSMID